MTTAQKIIKYLANAFAIFLIVTIISSVLNIGYGILSAIGAITTKENKILDDFITIDLGAGNITIDNIIVSKETKINGGVGEINISTEQFM